MVELETRRINKGQIMNYYEAKEFKFYPVDNRGWTKDFMKNIGMINSGRCVNNAFGQIE